MIFFCFAFVLNYVNFFLFFFFVLVCFFVVFSGGLETYIDPAGNTGNAGLDHL